MRESVTGRAQKSSFIYVFGKPSGREGKPMEKRGQNILYPFCPHLDWVSSLLTSHGQCLDSQWLGWCRARRLFFM